MKTRVVHPSLSGYSVSCKFKFEEGSPCGVEKKMVEESGCAVAASLVNKKCRIVSEKPLQSTSVAK